MNGRISEVRKSAGMTQEEFAAKIGLSRNFIWMIEKGDRIPSDRTIRDICEKFNVSEAWLRDGIEPMYIKKDADDDLNKMFEEIGASDDELIKAIVKAYWRLDDSQKSAVRKLIDNLLEEMDKKKNPGD